MRGGGGRRGADSPGNAVEFEMEIPVPLMTKARAIIVLRLLCFQCLYSQTDANEAVGVLRVTDACS